MPDITNELSPGLELADDPLSFLALAGQLPSAGVGLSAVSAPASPTDSFARGRLESLIDSSDAQIAEGKRRVEDQGKSWINALRAGPAEEGFDSAKWLDFASSFGAPTTTGTFTESFGRGLGALSKHEQRAYDLREKYRMLALEKGYDIARQALAQNIADRKMAFDDLTRLENKQRTGQLSQFAQLNALNQLNRQILDYVNKSIPKDLSTQDVGLYQQMVRQLVDQGINVFSPSYIKAGVVDPAALQQMREQLLSGVMGAPGAVPRSTLPSVQLSGAGQEPSLNFQGMDLEDVIGQAQGMPPGPERDALFGRLQDYSDQSAIIPPRPAAPPNLSPRLPDNTTQGSQESEMFGAVPKLPDLIAKPPGGFYNKGVQKQQFDVANRALGDIRRNFAASTKALYGTEDADRTAEQKGKELYTLLATQGPHTGAGATLDMLWSSWLNRFDIAMDPKELRGMTELEKVNALAKAITLSQGKELPGSLSNFDLENIVAKNPSIDKQLAANLYLAKGAQGMAELRSTKRKYLREFAAVNQNNPNYEAATAGFAEFIAGMPTFVVLDDGKMLTYNEYYAQAKRNKAITDYAATTGKPLSEVIRASYIKAGAANEANFTNALLSGAYVPRRQRK